ncbi:T9SS type A sorting domain-containing protein [Flavobacterium sp. AC]|uniref:T9SS type A sorting domain-containing protein n=1 Tax=Flavobacterium azizsancarii TaxID=2961580 RepID=A0ABT4WF76_9FLAO|nr:T9SS type A sorting domain-containing protein [Flavobacterium azizsancarii]MDA6071243.1 T9SS type A sorting domain-containing protein [Flavobacterium azizsancarii]
MRKNYIYLVLLLAFNTGIFAQKVILTPTAVNGASVSSSGPINLGGTPYSTVSLGIRVEMPSIPGNTGTISIYSLNGLNANVVAGGNGGSLIFNEGNVASRSFVVNLNWGDFPTSGGFIYAEYKTSGSVTYKSGYIAVIKNATIGGGVVNPPADALNPSKIPNSLCCNQTIRQGDRPAPITGSQYLDPYENYIYGINSRWNAANASVLNLDNNTKTLYLDYTTELKNITVTRELGYKGNNEYPNKSNTITITVVPNPILKTNIFTNEPLNSDGFIELSSVKKLSIDGTSSSVSLNILQDPYHIAGRTDNIVNVDAYKWEYTKTNIALGGHRTWITIPNENSGSLDFRIPLEDSSLEDNYYLIRRIAVYKNITRVSEPLKVLMRGVRYENTICCDQTLKISSLTEYESPATITGSIPIVDNINIVGTDFLITSISYQWQSQTTENRKSIWSNIPSATSKDYLPPSSSLKVISNGGRRGVSAFKFESSFNFRRIAIIQYRVFNTKWIYGTLSSYSNETSLTGSANEPYTKIYPNPTSSTLNIQSMQDISNAKIRITNIMGITSNYNFSIINSNLISIDVSQLITGTYFISIDTRDNFNSTFIKH